MKKELELYIHIPFCVKKCDYCDFLSGPADAGRQREYVEALKKEIQRTDEEIFVSISFLKGEDKDE